jgi:23S rRNA (uracil1939-C5)-methyltransferase
MTDAISTTVDVTITRLGAQADGVGQTEDGPIYVPYTLPGERVTAAMVGQRGALQNVLAPSADRIVPLCRHFTHCGGCATQHMARAAEAEWKRALVVAAFSHQRIYAPAVLADGATDEGINVRVGANILPLLTCEPGSRRRAVFAARRTKAGIVFGFHAPQSHEIIDLAECPILSSEIWSRLPGLRALVTPLLSRSGEARITVTAADNGIDVVIEDSKPELSVEVREAVNVAARAARVIRLSIGGETVFESGTPFIRFGLADVVPPPGVFLQAVPTVEKRMTELMIAAIGKAKRVADLFCGLGTFALPLAVRSEVLAVDSDKAALAALGDATRRTQGLKPITTKVRDLFREPLSAKELELFDAVVFDPPRAGAEAQARMIAKSKVKTVIAVSCAPGTLARDVGILMEGGFKLESVTPIDQFLFSPHVEALAILRRPKR